MMRAPFGGSDFGADLADLAVLQDDRDALHFRAGHRVYVHIADDDGLGGQCDGTTQ